MRTHALLVLSAGALVTGCDNSAPRQPPADQPTVRVRSAEQDQLHKLDALNLAVGLKRAIYDAGFICKTITDAGYVGTYKNLDMWMAKCADGRSWAVFAGPDGSAQVRDCRDVPGTGLPECAIKQRPAGTFNKV
jgi:hypothetical protein